MKDEGPAAEAERLQLLVWSLIGEAFEKRRKDGLNQSKLARRLGVPRGQVCLWLRDRERMTLKAAARLAAAMGYDVDVRLARRMKRAVPTAGDQ
ncbi:MAG: helix-turn-helix domain-containing protein [Bordetella sp.]|nr:helix-turn-helix domain-containing protein [Bordetella sp.]